MWLVDMRSDKPAEEREKLDSQLYSKPEDDKLLRLVDKV